MGARGHDAMNAARGKTVGGTLPRAEGSPSSAFRRLGATIRLALGPALAAVALVASLLALVEASVGSAEAGVVVEDQGGVVTDVAIGGFAWTDGIRPGQTVLELRAADDPGGWLIQTGSSGEPGAAFVSSQELHTASLRASWPLAATALVLATVAMASATTRRRRAESLATLALVACAIPLELRGHVVISPGASVVALVAPGLWLARWTHVPSLLRVGVVAACVSIAAAWVWARTSSPDAYTGVDSLRIGVGYLVAISVLATAPGVITTRWLRSSHGLRAADVAAASALVTLLAATHFLFAAPVAVTALLGLLGLALYSRWRNAVFHHLDRLFLGDLRERASLDAIETERSRLARDLHDEPLQQLAGVIKRLETRPDTAPQADLLRNVADQLRAVATDLHPPVLDDLGLMPAIEFIARSRDDSVVTVDIQADAGYQVAARPPAVVELAIFRIVQEAVTNAVTHSRSPEIRIHGLVSSDHIEVSITDNGVGLTPRLVSQAMRNGRLGLASMRRRAEAIDGDLDIRGKPNEGTTVTIRWSA